MRTRALMLIASGILVAATATASAYEEKTVTNGGSISGSVRVTGEIPVLPPMPVYKEGDACGATMRDERLLVGKDGVLQNAVVFLDGVDSGKPIRREDPVTLDNVKCAFVPHVAAGTVGQTLSMHNSDAFLHDAHAWMGARTVFNVALLKGKTKDQPLSEPGLIHINCNVRHTWMHAYLFVTEHPYRVVTDAGGRFSLDQVPPGTYRIAVWHELLGSREREVTVAAGQGATVDFELEAVAPQKP